MITITNTKIAGFEPRWASFKGFSLLFDNPNRNLSSMENDLLQIKCSVDSDPSLQFYKTLVNSLDKIGRNQLINTYLFCPLPPFSFHVTVWDGLNDANAQNIVPQHRLELENFLKNLPSSFLGKNIFTAEIDNSPLITKKEWNIKFKFDELAKWSNQALVARLMAADEDSQNSLGRLIEERKILSEEFQRLFQIKRSRHYSPHVTLGYFANKEYAELATPRIADWSEVFKKQAENQTIAFDSISLYGFTDMSTFFKNGVGYELTGKTSS